MSIPGIVTIGFTDLLGNCKVFQTGFFVKANKVVTCYHGLHRKHHELCSEKMWIMLQEDEVKIPFALDNTRLVPFRDLAVITIRDYDRPKCGDVKCYNLGSPDSMIQEVTCNQLSAHGFVVTVGCVKHVSTENVHVRHMHKDGRGIGKEKVKIEDDYAWVINNVIPKGIRVIELVNNDRQNPIIPGWSGGPVLYDGLVRGMIIYGDGEGIKFGCVTAEEISIFL